MSSADTSPLSERSYLHLPSPPVDQNYTPTRGPRRLAYVKKHSSLPPKMPPSHIAAMRIYSDPTTSFPKVSRRQYSHATQTTPKHNLGQLMLPSLVHDTRAPLNACMFSLMALRQTALDAQQRQLVSDIVSSHEYILRLVNDAMDLQKLGDGSLKLVIESFVLVDMLKDVVRICNPLATAYHVTLHITPTSF